MFHVMVRSFEGWRLNGRGDSWTRKEVWSTFQSDASYTLALLTKFELEGNGVHAIVVPDHQYVEFCAWHKVA